MKKSIFIVSAMAAFLVACTAKKATTTTTEAAPVEMSVESRVQALQAKYPGTTVADVEKGKNVSKTSCNSCHKEKDYNKLTDEKLLKEIDIMSKKAKISEEEKQALIRYAMSLRVSAK